MICEDCHKTLGAGICIRCCRVQVAEAAKAGLDEGLNASDNIYAP